MFGLGLGRLGLNGAKRSGAAWTPANLFTTGDGFWYDFKPLTLLKQNSAGTTPVTATNDPVGLVLDQSGDARNALQATSTARPLVKSSGSNYYVQFDKVEDRLTMTVPGGGWTGTMIHSTVAGTISYAATLPAGSFAIGTNRTDNFYAPDNRLAGQIFVNSALSDSDAAKVKDYFVGLGGGPKDSGAYAGVTDFFAAWASCSSMTGPFPLIDTSSGTDFFAAWHSCSSMTGPFPLIDTSSGTDFSYAWDGCISLTSFPANMFDACPATDFTSAFDNCALNQTSIDNILVSIAAAGTSGGTLDMTGGTNATPSATGLAAKATLVGRGWTVTHN